jgi:Protein of unknown function (DUF1554)
MARDDASTVVGVLLALALIPAFWPTGAVAGNDKIDERDAICAGYKGTALWGQCTRAVVHGCQDSAPAAPQCERWAQAWRDQTGVVAPWLLECGDAFGSKCVFVTSGVYDGNLGGLAGADHKCADEAKSEGSQAALGEYKAWLSVTDISPNDGTRFTQPDVPYKLVNGGPVAESFHGLLTGHLENPIGIDATSTPADVTQEEVWTATQDNGNSLASTGENACLNWTSVGYEGIYGLDTLTNTGWTNEQVTDCHDQLHLYCFEQ